LGLRALCQALDFQKKSKTLLFAIGLTKSNVSTYYFDSRADFDRHTEIDMLLSADILSPWFAKAEPLDTFIAGADLGQQSTWNERFQRLELDDAQQSVVDGFQRTMRILCLTGRWCGDCALQGAAFGRIAEAAGDCIDLRFLERSDETAELAVTCMINAGARVPVTWLMAEDGEPAARFGDRTLSRYRSIAGKTLGDAANAQRSCSICTAGSAQ
jgi:hypothetical protein